MKQDKLRQTSNQANTVQIGNRLHSEQEPSRSNPVITFPSSTTLQHTERTVEIFYFFRGTVPQGDTVLPKSQARPVNDDSDGGSDRRLCLSELSLSCDSSLLAPFDPPPYVGVLECVSLKFI